MGQDARIRYTKMVIQESFVSTLKEKPLTKITVKELCEKAEINRATFYKYYEDVYDLLYQIECGLLDDLKSAMQASLKSGREKTLVHILEKVKNNTELYTTLFSKNGDANFPLEIFKTCYSLLSDNMSKLFPQYNQTQRGWVYTYIAQGSSGILSYWIADGMTESPKEVAAFIESMISKTITGNS